VTKNILFVNGVSDEEEATVLAVQKNGALVYSVGGSSNVGNYIADISINKYFTTLESVTQQSVKLDRIDAVFNQIAEPDTHSITLDKVQKLYELHKGKIPFFNLPENIKKTSREKIYELLQGIEKISVPKTVRVQPQSPSDVYQHIREEKFTFPVIFRQAGAHGGTTTKLLTDESELFYDLPLDGRDYYLTQYVEYAEEGVYKKYRLVIIEGKIFLRHVIFGSEWMMHANSQFEDAISDPYKKDISKRFVKEIRPLIQPAVKKIYHAVGLDYFGIDCHIDKDGNMLIFEVNANMNVFVDLEGSDFKRHMDRAKQVLVKMLTA